MQSNQGNKEFGAEKGQQQPKEFGIGKTELAAPKGGEQHQGITGQQGMIGQGLTGQQGMTGQKGITGQQGMTGGQQQQQPGQLRADEVPEAAGRGHTGGKPEETSQQRQGEKGVFEKAKDWTKETAEQTKQKAKDAKDWVGEKVEDVFHSDKQKTTTEGSTAGSRQTEKSKEKM